MKGEVIATFKMDIMGKVKAAIVNLFASELKGQEAI